VSITISSKARASLQGAGQVRPPTRAAWRRWLSKNHVSSRGVWLILDKASAGKRRLSLSYVDAVEEALCFGWIDSTARGIDAAHYSQYFAPRKPKSVWSRSNKERVERLAEQRLMTPAGMACIEAAKKNGFWSSLDSIESLEVPDDLAAALAAEPKADRQFALFSPSARKAYLYWVGGAKRPETRARRIAEVVALALKNQKSRHLREPIGRLARLINDT